MGSMLDWQHRIVRVHVRVNVRGINLNIIDKVEVICVSGVLFFWFIWKMKNMIASRRVKLMVGVVTSSSNPIIYWSMFSILVISVILVGIIMTLGLLSIM